MKIHQFLEHHRIARNPFAEEDAQTDPVFKDHCIANTYHPTWDKVYGDPGEPSTSIVFGEKGAGKTALRLQIAKHLADYNASHPNRRVFVIAYDDFNPFLDRFGDRLHGRRKPADRVLLRMQLWDHMDAILSLGVTDLVDQIFSATQLLERLPSANAVAPSRIDQLDRHQRRDLLLLAACYDQSTAETSQGRWHRLMRAVRLWRLRGAWRMTLGILVTIAAVLLALGLMYLDHTAWVSGFWWAYVALVGIGWLPWLWHAVRSWRLAWAVVRHMRVGNRKTKPLARMLMTLTPSELTGQPLPSKDRTDDRYALLGKLQAILQTLGFSGIIVLVDRVDEPHMINGSTELMRAMLWPMLDNKFLKQPGLGIKFMLPVELTHFIEREDREFYQRARLDKQNMIPSLEWTGQSLCDLANARLEACALDGTAPTIGDLLDPAIGQQRVVDAFGSLRVPRHLFKFLYRLLVTHCNAHSAQMPAWTIAPETFESVLAVYRQSQDALSRGVGAG